MQFNVVVERDKDGRYVAECLDFSPPRSIADSPTCPSAICNLRQAAYNYNRVES